MKVLAVVNKNILNEEAVEFLPDISIANNNISLGVIEVDRPLFDENNKNNDNFVLVRVIAFSCNYRDKGIIVKAAINMEKMGNSGKVLEFFGSDFVGVVEKIGRNVKNVMVGDRIIPNCYYPSCGESENMPGVVTNEASKGWLKLHFSKVMKIKPDMSDEIASSFSIGAQTSSSMIRKVNLSSKDKILVTSGRSNTSQFIIKNLLRAGLVPDVITTSPWSLEEKRFLSPAKIIKIKKSDNNWDNYSSIGLYDVIFDPFFDLYMVNAINHLKMNGRYITCGYKNQHKSFVEKTDFDNSIPRNTILKAMIQNITMIGNCIGLTSDLSNEIKNYDKNCPPIMIDNIYDVYTGHYFLDKTYNSRRFGKAILKY